MKVLNPEQGILKDQAPWRSLMMKRETDDPYWVQTEFEKIQSKSVLHQVITNLELHQAWADEFGESRSAVDRAYDEVQRNLNVRQNPDGTQMELSVSGATPEESARIANGIAERYVESREQDRRQRVESGIQKLEAERDALDQQVSEKQALVDKLKTELGVSDKAVQGYAMTPTQERKVDRSLPQSGLVKMADRAGRILDPAEKPLRGEKDPVAGAFAEWLAESPHAGNVTLSALRVYLEGVPELYPRDPRPWQLADMIRRAAQIGGS